MKRAGKDASFKREGTQVVSVRLSPASVFLLNQLAADHGGAGRALQIAIELLATRKKSIKLQEEDDSKPREIFTFAAFPRTRTLIARLAAETYGSVVNVIRAAIGQLYELRMDEEDYDVARDILRR